MLNVSEEGIVCSEHPSAWCLLFQDEECLRPGEATDLSFLEKLEEKVGDHAHFVTYAFMLCILPQRKLSHLLPVTEQKLDSIILMGLFQLRVFCGSVSTGGGKSFALYQRKSSSLSVVYHCNAPVISGGIT